MCGICGFISTESMPEELLSKMIHEIDYRGPDDTGVYTENLNSGHQIGLAHCRLAILDLSLNGHQPMISGDGGTVIVFNGEIYNFKRLREELRESGCRFRTNTDTEVILCAYQEWGVNAFDKLNGMFAFALYDRSEPCVYLVRDRMGVKPLYYHRRKDGLVFASELKPIMEYPGFQKEIDRNALMTYLAAEYIPGDRCIFQDCNKLLPGEILKWTPEKVERKRYWSVQDVISKKPEFSGTYRDAVSELDGLIEDAVRLRMISDVPLGAFLSNGVDSTLMTVKMQKMADAPVKTFTVGFQESDFDESAAAERVAHFLGTEHRSEILSLEEGKKLFTELPRYFDEPMADPSSIATMLVSKMARETVTVAISGDAGDELFCGYNTYTHFRKLRKLSWVSRLLNSADMFVPLHGQGIRTNDRRMMKLLHLRSDEEIINADILSYGDRYGDLTNGETDLTCFSGIMHFGRTMEEKAMLHDLVTFLPDDVLTKVDRASMSVSLETRAPLLDYRIVELALRLPLDYKFQGGVQKRILKEILYREVPAELVGRTKKGFRIPFARWMREDFSELIEWYFSEEYIRRQGLFNQNALNRMIKCYQNSSTTDYAREVWTLLIFQLWYDRYCNI